VRYLTAALCVGLFLSTARADTYLVLPFFNLSKDSTLDWVGEGIAQALEETLASEGLITLDRDDRVEAYRRLSVRPYTQLTKASVVKIAQTLDAEHVLFGQFELKPAGDSAVKSRGSLQIVARLLDLKRVKQGPEFRVVGALEDLAALQENLAWQTMQYLKPKETPSEADFQRRYPRVRLDAIENYIRGLMTSNTDEKHRFYTQAARLDPQYSQPCFHLGRLLWRKKEYKSAAEWFQKVSPTDSHYREANFFLGLCRYSIGDFAGAQAAFQLVAKTVPLGEVYNNLGAAQSRGNLPGALDSFQKALEGDSSDPIYQFNLGYALWKTSNFQAAAYNLRAVLNHDPNDMQAALLLERCESQSGPRPGEPRMEGLERLKTNYQESAYWQLKAVLQPERP